MPPARLRTCGRLQGFVACRLVVAATLGAGLLASGERPGWGARPADEPWSTNRQLTLNANGVPHAMPAVAAHGSAGYAVWFDCSTFLRQAPGCLPFIGVAEWTGPGTLSRVEAASNNSAARKAYPSIAVDGLGTAYAVWLDGREYSGRPQYYERADLYFSTRPAGGSWSENARVNDVAGSARWTDGTDIQVDARGNAAAVWVDGQTTHGDIRYSYRPTGGQWSPSVLVDETAAQGHRSQPALALDPDGNSYVVWTDNGAVRFAYRPFGGRWTPSVRLDDATWQVVDPDVAVDPAGNVHVVWTGQRSLPAAMTLFERRRPAGGSWLTPAWLDVDAAGYTPRRSRPAIDTNADGDLYLAWLQYDPVGGLYLQEGDVRFAFRPLGGVWGPSERVNEGCCAMDDLGLAVDDEGGVHAVWTDIRKRPTDPERYRQDIFSAYRERPVVESPERLKIQGLVYGAPDASERFPIIGARVALLRGQQVVRSTLTLAPDGRYVLSNVPKEDGLVLQTTLEYAATNPPAYRVMYGRTSPPIPVELRTFPLALAGATEDITRDLVFTAPSSDDLNPRLQPEDLGSLAVIYAHSREAVLLAEVLGQRLDFKLPVDVVAFSREREVFWLGPHTLDPGSLGSDPYINIEAANASSYYLDADRPSNREWHEFGHHVMADALGNLLPKAPDSVNHDGYDNAYTTDSWVEGFAEYYSLLVGQEIARLPNPSRYTVGGAPIDLEFNYLAWNGEEYAIAGLLWDLQDPVAETDATFLGMRVFSDHIGLGVQTLWSLLSRDWGDTVRRSPHAPPGYGYIFDVKHLYDVLESAGIGAAIPPGTSMSALDQLFVAHGLFDDANGNRRFEEGEEIGRVGTQTLRNRRKAPRLRGSFLAADAVDDASGRRVEIRDFSVSWCFAAPLEARSYSWTQRRDATNGQLYFFGPDPQFDATAFVVAQAAGYRPSAPLAVPNADYWRSMAADPPDAFLRHTFSLRRAGAVYLPVLGNRGVLGAPAARTGPPAGSGSFGPRLGARAQAEAASEASLCGTYGFPTPPASATPDPRTPPTATAAASRTPVASPTTLLSPTVPAVSATPSPTPTPSPVSPEPTATPNVAGPDQRVADVTTTDAGNLTRTAFVAGDTVWLWALLVNDQPRDVEADVEFSVLAESGFVAESLSWRGMLTLPPGATWFRSDPVVPANLPNALYHLQVTVTVGGRWTTKSSALYLARSLVRADTFADPASGWPVGSTADATYGYADGEYRISLHTADTAWWATGGTRAGDVVFEADVRLDAGAGAAGLLIGLSDDAGDLTVFLVDGDGGYGLYRNVNGAWLGLVPWTLSPRVPPRGTGAHLMLVHRANRTRLFLAGIELTEPTAGNLPAGRLGWYAEAWQAGVETRFDNFRAYAP